jgi:hypothetical protein
MRMKNHHSVMPDNLEKIQMNRNVMLTISSLLSILFFMFHVADDIVRGLEPGGIKNYIAIIIMFVWLYATLLLAGRRLGYIVVLLFSILASAIPFLHMMGVGLVGGRIANSSGIFFWVWTLLALGLSSLISAALAGHGLWNLRKPKQAA